MKWRLQVGCLGVFILSLLGGLWACQDTVDRSNQFEIEDPDEWSEEDSKFVVEPDAVQFSGNLEAGDIEEKTVRLVNLGKGDLVVSDIEIEDDDAGVFAGGEDWPVDDLTLEDGEIYEFSVVYESKGIGEGEQSAVVVMRTNDPDNRRGEVALGVADPAGELDVEPKHLNFIEVPTNSMEWQVVEIDNVGHGPLAIDDISVTGGSDFFEVSFFEPPASEFVEPSGPEEDSTTPPEMLEVDDEPIWMRVSFTPDDQEPKTGEVTISTDDPLQETFVVELAGNSVGPCLNVSPEGGVDFEASPVGERSERTIVLENCSLEHLLSVRDLEIADDGGGVFSVVEDSLPDDFPENSHLVEPGGVMVVTVSFEPDEEDLFDGQLYVNTNDDLASELYIDLAGEGVGGDCPVAEAGARVDDGAAFETSLASDPTTWVEFDAGQSYDPDGTDLSYEWSIISRPSNSGAQLRFPERENTSAFVDVSGHYVVALSVVDESGQRSCRDAVVDITVAPSTDILVELSWTVPGSYDGTGTDLDLHYLHSDGEWGVPPHSVYWRNQDADWQDNSQVSIDIDSLDGSVPEMVSHDNPDPDHHYSVGAYYFTNQHNYGVTNARVRIYANGVLIFHDHKMMENAGVGSISADTDRGDFWYVADLDVDQSGVVEIDVINTVYEDGGFP